jgi:GH15 family glucan-1,4-alpha-glucosidase
MDDSPASSANGGRGATTGSGPAASEATAAGGPTVRPLDGSRPAIDALAAPSESRTPAPVRVPRLGAPYPPIGDYGFLSDCHTGALLASDGSIEWMCLPHFDSASVFAAMLDRAAGSFRVGPYGIYVPAGRRYIPGTNIVETTWMTPHGWLIVRDALAIGDWGEDKHGTSHTRPPTDYDAGHVLLRMIECVKGEVQAEMVCEPAFEYGALEAIWSAPMLENLPGFALDASCGDAGTDAGFRIYSDMRMGIEGNRVHARHTMTEGERCYCAMSWAHALQGPRSAAEAEEAMERTARFWRTWLSEGDFPDHPLRVYLQRSALVLKGLTFMPTGALLAALTTSLPETPGGSRNWDYRYCWMRDATFALWGLHALGLDWEADDFVEYIADLERNSDGSLQIMYGINGEKDLEERTLDYLKGYEQSRPVRVGNAAYEQRQNDVYGAVLDSVYLHSKQRDHIPERVWPVLVDQAESAARVWKEPDQGIWEARGQPRHYVSSKLMCWVAMDRGARLAERRGEPELLERWQSVADEIRADILERGVDGRGVFRQHYESDALDASNLLVPLVRFLPGDDERVRATVAAIQRELTEHGLVLRYRTDQTDDGQSGEEGTFLICSFWLVSALSEIGEHGQARRLLERVLSYASPLGLFAEELDVSSGRQLGNYPQAFTHLALLNAVTHVIATQER